MGQKGGLTASCPFLCDKTLPLPSDRRFRKKQSIFLRTPRLLTTVSSDVADCEGLAGPHNQRASVRFARKLRRFKVLIEPREDFAWPPGRIRHLTFSASPSFVYNNTTWVDLAAASAWPPNRCEPHSRGNLNSQFWSSFLRFDWPIVAK